MSSNNGPAPGAQGVQGITETDIANYLANNPGFFERHAELLSSVQLTSPHGQRAVSLQERQMEMLRERIKGLEHKIIEMIRNGQDNLALADKLHEQRAAMMGQSKDPRAELQALVAGDKFDKARAQTLVSEKTAAIQARSPEVIAALADFYDSLNPAQQQKVREFMQRRRGWHRG